MLIYKHSRGTAKLIITQTTHNRRLKVSACVLLSVTKKNSMLHYCGIFEPIDYKEVGGMT